MTIVMFFSVV